MRTLASNAPHSHTCLLATATAATATALIMRKGCVPCLVHVGEMCQPDLPRPGSSRLPLRQILLQKMGYTAAPSSTPSGKAIEASAFGPFFTVRQTFRFKFSAHLSGGAMSFRSLAPFSLGFEAPASLMLTIL